MFIKKQLPSSNMFNTGLNRIRMAMRLPFGNFNVWLIGRD